MSERFTPFKKSVVPVQSLSTSSATSSRAASVPPSSSAPMPTSGGHSAPIVIDDDDEDQANLHATHAKRRIGAVTTRKDDDEEEESPGGSEDEGSQGEKFKRARFGGSPPKAKFGPPSMTKPSANPPFGGLLSSSYGRNEYKDEEEEEEGSDDFDWGYWQNVDERGNNSNNNASSLSTSSFGATSHPYGVADDDDLIDDPRLLKSSAHAPTRFSDDEDEGEDRSFQTTTTTSTSSGLAPSTPSHAPPTTSSSALDNASSSSSSSSSGRDPLSSAEAAAAARTRAEWKRARNLPKETSSKLHSQSDAWDNLASRYDVPSRVQRMRGTQLTDQRHTVPLPARVSYVGQRARQVLHHHSEVLRWHLDQRASSSSSSSSNTKDTEIDPVEVQTHYLARNGKLHLTVSANQVASQEALADMTPDDVTRMYLEAAHSRNALVRRSARKVLAIDEVNQRRRQASTGSEESEADLERAAALAGLLVDRNAYTVVTNKYERHAEQTLRSDYNRSMDPRPGDETDVAGTLIRCGACSQEVGLDTRLTDLREAEARRRHAAAPTTSSSGPPPRPPDVTGIMYMAQISQVNMNAALKGYSEQTRKMHTGDAERPRSRSPSPERYTPPPIPARPKDTPSTSRKVERPGTLMSFFKTSTTPSSSSSAPPPSSSKAPAPSSSSAPPKTSFFGSISSTPSVKTSSSPSGAPVPAPKKPGVSPFFGSTSSSSSSALPPTPTASKTKAPPQALSLKKKAPSSSSTTSSKPPPSAPTKSPYFSSKPKEDEWEDDDDFM